jgi:hypothetical protein
VLCNVVLHITTQEVNKTSDTILLVVAYVRQFGVDWARAEGNFSNTTQDYICPILCVLKFLLTQATAGMLSDFEYTKNFVQILRKFNHLTSSCNIKFQVYTIRTEGGYETVRIVNSATVSSRLRDVQTPKAVLCFCTFVIHLVSRFSCR